MTNHVIHFHSGELTQGEWTYLIGLDPPHYPVPAIRNDAMLHIGYPRVLSEKDKANADAYFRQMFHRRYGKR